MIVLTVALLMIGIVIWSIYTPKVYMIKAAGTVTSENSNYIMPSYTGEIVDNYMQESIWEYWGNANEYSSNSATYGCYRTGSNI